MGYAGRLTSDAPASAASANTPPPFAPRPRSEAAAAVGGSSNLDLTNAVFAPRPRSEAAADFSGGGNSFLRPRSSDGPFLGSGGGNAGAAVRTCGCGAGCACPGCALHGVPVSSASVGGSQNVGASQSGQNQNGERHCADAACGGACLDCSILGLEDFSSVVGFGSGGAAEGGGAGYPNSSASGKGEILNKEGEYQFDALALEEYAAGAGDLDLDLDLEGLEVYNAELEGYDLGQDAFEQARQSAAIDEWIREVGALPPPPPVGPPFEFEGFDTSANANNMKVEFDVGGGMDFGAGDDAQFGNAGQWVFDVDAGSDGRMEGLTSADVTFPCTDSHAFLTVPGLARTCAVAARALRRRRCRCRAPAPALALEVWGREVRVWASRRRIRTHTRCTRQVRWFSTRPQPCRRCCSRPRCLQRTSTSRCCSSDPPHARGDLCTTTSRPPCIH
ncbi:hypothetical protein B0H13DRAFT_884026 [Mycena leptocephala]|nr:hypothetical protein B0H13DRAFT_884026 [Mycena leptocephala]